MRDIKTTAVRDRAVPYLKNASSGDFQHSKQFKFEEKYLS